jgi:hypothetical protein
MCVLSLSATFLLHREWLGAHWQLYLLSYLVARVENTALYEIALNSNFSVAATKKLQPVAA